MSWCRRAGLWLSLAMTLVVAAGCAGVAESSPRPVTSASLDAARVYRDQVYAQRGTGPLALDLYLPASARKPVPLVVYVHGGGWEAGNRALDGPMAGSIETQLATRLVENGYAVASVDYRLSTIAKAPAQVTDVDDAVRWLQQHSGRWGVDPNRIVLWGESAGGQIVSQLGAVVGDPAKPGGGLHGIRGVVDWFGPSDMTEEALAQDSQLPDYSRRVVNGLLGCTPAQCPRLADESSPIKNLSPDMPPFLIQQGTADQIVPISQSLDLAAALRQLGVPVEMHPYEGLNHGFPANSPLTPQIINTVTTFVNQSLRP
jgi:acetyl esterase/lipase